MNQRLVNDCASMMMEHLLARIRNCLRDEEIGDAREVFFEICRAGIEAYEVQMDRMQRRLHPTTNQEETMQQQQKELTFGQRFNIAVWIMWIYMIALVIPARNRWGVRPLGVPCALAVLLMLAWATVTQDPWMWMWLGFWFVSFARRRIEANKLKGQIHTHQDGVPEGIRLCKSDKNTRMFAEPLIFGILGGFLFWLYRENGLSPTGLPFFFLGGAIVLPFLEMIRNQIWERRLENISDGRIEQEALMRDYRNRHGS